MRLTVGDLGCVYWGLYIRSKNRTLHHKMMGPKPRYSCRLWENVSTSFLPCGQLYLSYSESVESMETDSIYQPCVQVSVTSTHSFILGLTRTLISSYTILYCSLLTLDWSELLCSSWVIKAAKGRLTCRCINVLLPKRFHWDYYNVSWATSNGCLIWLTGIVNSDTALFQPPAWFQWTLN